MNHPNNRKRKKLTHEKIYIIRKRISDSSIFVPFCIFLVLIVIYILTNYFTNIKPVITSIYPEIGFPGETLEISGKHFGNPNSQSNFVTVKPVDISVYIANRRLVLSDYISWSDEKIKIKIPQNISSGSVWVESKGGKSNDIIFINKREIPIVISGAVEPGKPYINSFFPIEGAVNDIITLTGMSFGMDKGGGKVYFTLTSTRDSTVEETAISASETDHGYISWSDNEIKVRVPDGASSGKMWVETDSGESNSFYFEKIENAGTRTLGEKRGYQGQYTVSLSVQQSEVPTEEKLSVGNSVYLWIPKLSLLPEQRKIEYETNIQPELDNFQNLMLYKFTNLPAGARETITVDVLLERYEVNTKVLKNKVKWNYDKEERFYGEFTKDLYDLKLDDNRLTAAFRRIPSGIDPYTTAQAIYNIVREMEYVSFAGNDIVDNFLKKQGDSYTYAMIFSALARKKGIPARPVAGFIVYDNESTVSHFWAEFYLKGFGWVPVDPALGDGAVFGNIPRVENPVAYYFGNMDSYHITFSKGIISVPAISPNGKTVFKNKLYSLQSAYEEYSGAISSYKTDWNDLKILEWW